MSEAVRLSEPNKARLWELRLGGATLAKIAAGFGVSIPTGHRVIAPRGGVARWLRLEFAGNAAMQISHETIYRCLFIQARGALKTELISHLRSGRTMRQSKKAVRTSTAIPNLISIRERPAEVEDRAVPGHWEGDLIVGSNGSHILTLVERHTRYVMLGALPNKQTDTVVRTLTRLIRRLPTELRRTLTWDRGSEMAHHEKFTIQTSVQVYFCDP